MIGILETGLSLDSSSLYFVLEDWPSQFHIAHLGCVFNLNLFLVRWDTMFVFLFSCSISWLSYCLPFIFQNSNSQNLTEHPFALIHTSAYAPFIARLSMHFRKSNAALLLFIHTVIFKVATNSK